VSGSATNLRLRSRIAAMSIRTIALATVMAAAAFLAIGAIFDLATDAAGNLPGDHSATFQAVTGTNWQQAASAVHPVTPYATRAEASYAAFELLFGALFLVVAAIPLRRAERWAWWCSWLLILAFAAFAALFGPHNSANLMTAAVAGIVVALALIAIHPRPSTPDR
jgi:hypothetical protein